MASALAGAASHWRIRRRPGPLPDTAMVLLAGILRAEIIGIEPRTGTVPVADVIDAWRASEEGPCVRCGARTCIYGPRGNPLRADYCPPETGATVIPIPVGLTGQEYQRKPTPDAARRGAVRRGWSACFGGRGGELAVHRGASQVPVLAGAGRALAHVGEHIGEHRQRRSQGSALAAISGSSHARDRRGHRERRPRRERLWPGREAPHRDCKQPAGRTANELLPAQ
jgi:hypothetical protein